MGNMPNSRGGDFKLPSVSNKQAMGGMKGLPGMPQSKGGMPQSKGRVSQNGIKPPKMNSYQSNLGAGYNNKSGLSGAGLNAFNVPKYGGSGIGGSGIGGGLSLGSYGSSSGLGGIGSNFGGGGLGGGIGGAGGIGSSQGKREGSRQGS